MAIRRRVIPTAAAAKRASSRVKREPGGGLSPRAETIASTTPIIFETVDVARGSRLCLSAVGLMMGTSIGIGREEDDLSTALAGLGKFRASAARAVVETKRQYNPGWNTPTDLQNLLTVSEALTHAAPDRPESPSPTHASSMPIRA